METELTIEQIRKTKNTQILFYVILAEQAESWYDPCGKSGEDIKPRLTSKAMEAIKRARRVMGLDGHGGVD